MFTSSRSSALLPLQHPPFDSSNLSDNSMRSPCFITGRIDSPSSFVSPCPSSVTKAETTVAEDDQLLSDRHWVIELNAAPKWSNMAGTKDQGDLTTCLELRPPDFGPMHTKTVACCARDMTLLKRDDEEAKLFLISTVQFVATLSTNCSGVGDLSQCAWITTREELKCAQPSSGSQFFIAEQAIRLCTNM